MTKEQFSEPETLVDRLRGIYTVSVNDGAGLLNGKDTFTRTFPNQPSIQLEAANEIEKLREEIKDLKTQIEHLDRTLDDYWIRCR